MNSWGHRNCWALQDLSAFTGPSRCNQSLSHLPPWFRLRAIHQGCAHTESTQSPTSRAAAAFSHLAQTLKLNCESVWNLIARFTSPVCASAHMSSEAHGKHSDWAMGPCRAASAWPPGAVMGVFANLKWRPDYTGGVGNKKPQRNLGVTLHKRSPLEKQYQCVRMDVFMSPSTHPHTPTHAHTPESIFCGDVQCVRPLIYQVLFQPEECLMSLYLISEWCEAN